MSPKKITQRRKRASCTPVTPFKRRAQASGIFHDPLRESRLSEKGNGVGKGGGGRGFSIKQERSLGNPILRHFNPSGGCHRIALVQISGNASDCIFATPKINFSTVFFGLFGSSIFKHFSPSYGSHWVGRVQISGTASDIQFLFLFGLKSNFSNFLVHMSVSARMYAYTRAYICIDARIYAYTCASSLTCFDSQPLFPNSHRACCTHSFL